MSTRSNISIKIKDEDLGRQITHLSDNTVVTLGKYMTIYCHSDGYVDGVGKALYDEYNSYEKVLNLILEGDCSSIGVPYYKWEKYSDNKPKGSMERPKINEEYLYVFEDGEWYVSSEKHPDFNGELIIFLNKENKNE